jgi:lauroyl/myristoyl acyltransferase
MALTLAGRLPRRWAYALGELLADRVASQDTLPLTRALRANLAVILSLPQEHPEVGRRVRRLVRLSCRSYVDFARAARHSGSVGGTCFRMRPETTASLDDALSMREGVILAGAHTCSFDLLLIAISWRFPDVLILTKPNPAGGSKQMNRMRIHLGLDILPISAESLREAVRRLRQGGIVALAADVPTSDAGDLAFFGRTSRLTDGFARIALAGGARIMAGLSRRLADGVYEGIGEFVPPPPARLGRQRRARAWAQQSLVHLESLLRQWPDEWLMPEPVWEIGSQSSISSPASATGTPGQAAQGAARA